MKFFLALFISVCFHFYFFGMENPKTEPIGHSNQELSTLHLYNFQANDELLNKPHVWFSYKQENLFEACEISDTIREILRKSKPLLVALRQVDQQVLDQKKDECSQLARTLNKATNILTARIVDCKPEYAQTPAFIQLAAYIRRTHYYLHDIRAIDQVEIKTSFIKEDHPIIELDDAYDSIRKYINPNL